ncbi:TetR/AcrR family transcriptional regulator [Thermaerobacter subterraneus]|uniref:Transcriptional regulator n=1 Tax=Thermaerobacter subterraneus DSM 13965 TaxID=867903 RepID=K6PSB9_9FIRM|nr:TetR/AcrR family transcriptional regulator [Thermaerobacter subterraneus]EKP95862.1 transcriptional regulator [Thermaerobacter subterraneus DSM 13965]
MSAAAEGGARVRGISSRVHRDASSGAGAAGRIRRAAAGLFLEQGYHATGLRQVAAAAGVAVGTVYAHFPDKPSLLRAVLEEQAARLGRQLARVHLTPGLPAGERWAAFRQVLVEALPWLACEAEAAVETRAAGRAAGRQAAAAGGLPAGWPVTALLVQALARLLEEGARRGEARLLQEGGVPGPGAGPCGSGIGEPGRPGPPARAGGGLPAGPLREAGGLRSDGPGQGGVTADQPAVAATATARAVVAAAVGLWQAGCAGDLDWLWYGLGRPPAGEPAAAAPRVPVSFPSGPGEGPSSPWA